MRQRCQNSVLLGVPKTTPAAGSHPASHPRGKHTSHPCSGKNLPLPMTKGSESMKESLWFKQNSQISPAPTHPHCAGKPQRMVTPPLDQCIATPLEKELFLMSVLMPPSASVGSPQMPSLRKARVIMEFFRAQQVAGDGTSIVCAFFGADWERTEQSVGSGVFRGQIWVSPGSQLLPALLRAPVRR